MKVNFILLFVLFFFIGLHSQERDNMFLIDSLKKNAINSKIHDSSNVAYTHYKIGELYRYSLASDSAYIHYYKAEKYFRNLKNNYQLALCLYGISVIQTFEKDYMGSEITSIEAISLLEKLKETDNVKRYKSYIYNNLGIGFNELEQYEESIKYHLKSLDLKKKLKGNNKLTIDRSLNNIGFVYKNLKEYDKASSYYNEILSNPNLKEEEPNVYALVLNNYAQTLYLSKDYTKIPKLYFEALRLTNKVSPESYNSIIINQNLAEYYNDIENKDSARYYAYKAKETSKFYYKDDLLKSLLLLSNIEEGDIAVRHLKEYVKLNDSLQKNERTVRNKFARIRYETSKIEEENIKIARERMWLLIISITLIVASFLLYAAINQRNKNKELKFIQQQQETNEEIYNLMLSQQDNIEEARVLEKKRISEELHDGVLGRLFGTRLSLDSLNMGTSKDAIDTRSQYINELKTIEEDIRKVSHELNTDFVTGSGFSDIIEALVKSQTASYQLQYELDIAEAINWDVVSNKDKIHVYRIIQETLHNIYKHANATHVLISFKLKKSVICLKIIDDGVGFDVNKVKPGIGLKNINSRVKEIKGTIHIKSKKEKGTTVTIELPIPNNQK